MDAYNKSKVENFKSSQLLVYWWNRGKRTLDYTGTVEDYLKREKVTYSVRAFKDDSLNFERLKFKAKMSVGSMNFSFDGYDLEDLIRMSLNVRLTYLGDKSMYSFKGRVRTINF